MSRNLKPKLQIDKFSEAGKGRLFYNEGLIADNENGNSLLYDGYRSSKEFDNSDTAFSSLSGDNIMAIQYLSRKAVSSDKYRLILTSSGKFLSKTFSSSDIKDAVGLSLSSSLTSSGTYLASSYPDLLELPSGNLIFSSTNHLGLVVRGYCATGSSTTKIIDTQGRNFTTLGLSSSDPNNKVWNLKTGTIHTITSISTTTSTNDTLNFDAGTANTQNDEFIAVVWDKWSLKTDISPVPTYSSNDKRQIKASSDAFYVLNNNYLGKLVSDESTFYNKDVVGENKGKLLPIGHKAEAFETNTNRILVSSSKTNGENFLLLWDGYSDGWNNIINVDYKINCLKSYKSGWVYVSNGILYYTDGFSIQEMSSYNDTNRIDRNTNSLMVDGFNSITELKDTIYIVSTSDNINRVKLGVYAFNPKSGWSFIPIVYKSRLYGTPKSIFFSDIKHREIEVGMADGLSYIREGSNTNQYLNKSCIYLLNLKEETQIFGIGLNLGVDFNKYITGFSAEKKTKITVSIGDGKKGIIYYYQGNVDGTGSISIDDTNDPVDIGDEIIFYGIDSKVRGERTFVTDKTTLVGEISLSVSPQFSQTDDETRDFKLLKLKKCDTKEILVSELNREQIFFNPNPFLSNKLFVEITIQGITNSFPVSIMGINVY